MARKKRREMLTTHQTLRSFLLCLATITVGTGLYYLTQFFLGARPFPIECIDDLIFKWTTPINHYVQANPSAANWMLGSTSFIFDAASLFLFLLGFFGPSFAPFIGLSLIIMLRLVMQLICPLPPSPEIIWYDPGFPSIFVTYNTIADFFFSGHTATDTFATIQLARFGKKWLTGIGVILTTYTAIILLSLRIHYTMDIYTGLMTALLVAVICNKIGPTIDNWIIRLSSRVRV